MSMHILTINAGSATIKLAVFNKELAVTALYKAQADKSLATKLEIKQNNGQNFSLDLTEFDHQDFYSVAITTFIEWLNTQNIKIALVSHRVVHGGTKFFAPVLINADIILQLAEFNSLAPLHQPWNVQAIQKARELLPDCPQVACFDTAFHHTNPRLNRLYAIPLEWEKKGIKRYGFHGISYAFIQQQLMQLTPELAMKKIIIAHLGQGASLCALDKGISLLTSMGFSAVDGLMMGTRSGCLDPGVILYWLQSCAFTAADVEDIIYRKSGLLGISGLSNDMRTLLSSAEDSAHLAIELFVKRVVQQMGLLIAELQGLDAIVFTGGIGEHAMSIRAAIIEKLNWLGAELNSNANANNALLIDSDQSKIKILVIPTNEEFMLAKYALEVIEKANQ